MEVRRDEIIAKHLWEDVPKSTGIYIFQGKPKESGEPSVLYVGKAKNLYSRVRQYFIEGQDTRPFVAFIRKKVESIRYLLVETEQDALILENEMIKKYRPPYNISLRDDKRYLSLRLAVTHEWPKIDVVRKIDRDGAIYLGPFSSAGRLRMTLDYMQKIFPLRTCTDAKLYSRKRPCIEYEIKRCVAPCVNYVTKEEYQKLVQSAVLFLRGQNQELEEQMRKQMEEAAESEKFEEAAEIRNRLEAIHRTTASQQSVVAHQQVQAGIDVDVVGIYSEQEVTYLLLLFVRSGIIFDQRGFEFKNQKLDPETFLAEFLERYYSSAVYVPHEILIPYPIDTSELLVDSKILVPRIDEKKKYLEIAAKNAEAHLQAKLQKSRKLEKTLTSIQSLLSLSRYPETMDCLDISHHQGLETVASVVRFRDGVPESDFYRKIKIKVDQVDDFESMREAVTRRYKAEEDLPALIVIDGGRGQLGSAKEVLQQKGWLEKVDLVSLAKARDNDGIDPLNPQNRERVFLINQKNPILLRPDTPEELLLRYLRDEAHRFAITYHRLRKNKQMSASVLDEVEGMTERLKLKLLRKFGSVEGIHDATDFELLQTVPSSLAQRLRLKLSEALGNNS